MASFCAYEPSAQQSVYLALIAKRGYSNSAHLALGWTLMGSVEADRLEEAIRKVVLRHDSLRTVFPGTIADKHQGAIWDNVPQQALEHSHRTLSSEALSSWIFTPFDLRSGPLYRAILFPDDMQRSVLAFTFHHMIIDGGSLALFTRSLNDAYARDVPLPPDSEATYRMYAQSQKTRALSNKGKQALQFWTHALRALPAVQPLPFESDTTTCLRDSGCATLPLSPPLTKRLCARASSAGVTPFVLTLAVFFSVLAQETGTADHTVIIPVDSRPSSPRFIRTLGLFVNPLPVRLVSTPADDAASVLLQLAPMVWKMLEFRFTPYAEVCRAARGHKVGPQSPLRRIFARYDSLAGSRSGVRIAGLNAEALPLPLPLQRVHDLCMQVCQRGGQIDIYFTSNGTVGAAGLTEFSALYARELDRLLSENTRLGLSATSTNA